jgi:hypothetical protein
MVDWALDLMSCIEYLDAEGGLAYAQVSISIIGVNMLINFCSIFYIISFEKKGGNVTSIDFRDVSLVWVDDQSSICLADCC